MNFPIRQFKNLSENIAFNNRDTRDYRWKRVIKIATDKLFI